METAVAIETIDQLSIYTYVYVDNFRQNIHDETIVILFPLQIECLQMYGFASSIYSWRVNRYIPA